MDKPRSGLGTQLETGKPVAEVMIEGELSPFEHEALYKILRERFSLEQPSYAELPDEDLATRINIKFRYPFKLEFFTQVLQESWRDLKDLFKEVRRRRGHAGAGFNIIFADGHRQLVFKSGSGLSDEGMVSAMDQIGHLTGILTQMTRPENATDPLGLIECVFDSKSDRWHDFRALSLTGEKKSYLFDDSGFKWTVQDH